MSALAPQAALTLAVRLLEARGFAVSARNERGDSTYLRPIEDGPLAIPEQGLVPFTVRDRVRVQSFSEQAHPSPQPSPGRERERVATLDVVSEAGRIRPEGPALAIRVSNHARTAKQRRNHPDVATSLVIRAPKTSAQVAQMVEAALRDFEAARSRQAAAPP